MATDAELLEEARSLLQMAVGSQAYREWRPGEVKRIETFLDRTVAGDETPVGRIPPNVTAWAAEVSGNAGEEGEHTLYFDPENVDNLGLWQVWDEVPGDVPVVGFFARWYADREEFRRDLTLDEAIELAAMLLTHAEGARQRAVEKALDGE